MKINEIKEGCTYTNGLDGGYYAERKVLAINGESLSYKHIRGFKRPGFKIVEGISVKGFANWAREEVMQ